MIKVVGFCRKRSDLTLAEFRDYWLNEHSRMERESLTDNPIRRIVANFWQEDVVDKAPFHGMVELYYDTIEDMRRIWGSGHHEDMMKDGENFVDPDYSVFCIMEEVEIGSK